MKKNKLCCLLIFFIAMISANVSAQDTTKVVKTELIKVQKYLVPTNITAKGYAAHVELGWSNVPMFKYNIYRSQNGSPYQLVGTTEKDYYIDFVDDPKRPHGLSYLILPQGMEPSDPGAAKFMVSAQTRIYSSDELLDMIQNYTTRYFLDFCDPTTKMARERTNNPNGNIVTTGGTGFGIMTLVAGANRGFFKDSLAIDYIDDIVAFLSKAERFRGAWAHSYNVETGKPFSKSQFDDGGDLIETAFLVQGLLTAKSWLTKKNDSLSAQLSRKIDKMWREVDWQWYTQGGRDSLYCHWSKNFGWKMNHVIKGFDESLITHVLAASSPTYAIHPNVYHKGYTCSPSFKNDSTYFEMKLPLGMSYGGPLYFTHYSFLGLNPNGLKDQYADYFQQNKTHSMIHYLYAINNPNKNLGLGENVWGFTACDDPIVGFSTHQPGTADENGTVAPTAAISSIIYTPKESLKTIEYYYYILGDKIFGKYGFYDSFNLGLIDGQQVVHSYLAADQGPIAIMIENHRSQLLWNLFMENDDVQKGLKSLGFEFSFKE